MEMVMRDVLGGMEELAIMKSMESPSNVFEILAIPPRNMKKSRYKNQKTTPQSASATIIAFSAIKKIHHK